MTISRKGFLKALGFGILASQVPRGWAAAAAKIEESGAGKLRIKDVEIYAFDIPLKQPFRISLGVSNAANDVLVRVVTDSGIVGLGESCPFPPITGDTQDTNLLMARSIREMIKGKDPLAVDSLLGEIGHIVYSNPSIVAAFDMALMDILGKAAGLPLFRLLGGDKATFETDITTGMDTPEKMAASAGAHASQGYKNIKMKVGLDPDLDAERVQAVREAIGKDVRLRIDANQGWTVPQAIYALRKMERFNIQFVEQPVVAWDIAGLKAVRNESPIPVCADEALFLPQDAMKLIKAEACDYFNIKLMKAGGMTNSIRIAHLADAANMRCMVGCMLETRLALTAGAHVVASQRNITFADLDGYTDHTLDPIVGGMAVSSSGEITLPELPGLGLDVDPAFLKKLKRV
ncbi:MAG: dipeptide epimerase [Candidatus Aminicenantes bacterium]|nr:dipeptide epimerase [Candidatus Aminicenantes bacterium]